MWDGKENRNTPYCNCGSLLTVIDDKVEDIRNILTGNKVARNTDHRHFMSKWGWLVVSLITAAPFTIFIWVVIGIIKNGTPG